MKPAKRSALAAGVAGLLCSVTALIGIGPVLAGPDPEPDSLTLTYQCAYPLIGKHPLKVKLDSSKIPKRVVVDTPVEKFVVESESTVNAGATRGLKAVFSSTLEGEALAFATLNTPDYGDVGVKVNSILRKTTIPESGEFTVPARGTSPAVLRFMQAGIAKVSVGNLLLTITPRLEDGLESGLGTFEVECTQDPGQNNLLAEIEIVDKTTDPTDYALKGSTHVKAVNGNVQLTGAAKTTGDLTLDQTTGTFKALGFLPVTADIAFAQAGPSTAVLTGKELTTSSKVTVKLPKVKVLGIEIGGGASCQTATPAELTLKSADFDRAKGGNLSGTYTLPKLQGCGTFTPFISALVAGPGNTVSVTLTGQQKA